MNFNFRGPFGGTPGAPKNENQNSGSVNRWGTSSQVKFHHDPSKTAEALGFYKERRHPKNKKKIEEQDDQRLGTSSWSKNQTNEKS